MRTAVRIAGGVVVAWLIAAGVFLVATYLHVKDGEAAVQAAQKGIKASTLTAPHAPDLLAPVRSEFAAAHGDLGSPLLAPLDALPVLGRQLRAVKALTVAAQQVAVIGEGAEQRARVALRQPHQTGPQRVAAIKALADAASTADSQLGGVSLGSDRALVSFVASKRNQFATRLAKLQSGIHRAAVAGEAAATLFAGPSHLLLLAGNNAEMRDGSGMFLAAAEVDLADGQVTLGSISDTRSIPLAAGAVPLTGDLAARWGFLAPNEEWRNLALNPDFDMTAALAARMWQATTGHAVDGVLAIDIAGLKALLEATGPVQAGSQTVSPDNVTQLLLHDQYVGVTDQQARQDQLGVIARSVLDAVQNGGYDSSALAQQLPGVVSGRHLMLWSARPDLEAAWRTAGTAGVMRADTLMVTLLNRGVNKLDQFVRLASDLEIRSGGGSSALTLTVHITNATPPGEPAYIAGGFVPGLPASSYYGYVAVTLPFVASGIQVDGQRVANVAGPEGINQVVATLRTVAPGQTLTVVFTFTLPGVHGHLQVESAARIPPATYRLLRPTPSAPIPDDHRPRFAW